MVRKIELRIDASNAIICVASRRGGALTIDENAADIRSLQNVSLDPQHGELIAGNSEARCSLTEFAGLHLQEADVVSTDSSGDFCTVVNWHRRAVVSQSDSAREESLVLSFTAKEKDAGVLQKEIAFFGEEDGEAAEIDYLIIDLGLTEVGICGELSSQ